MLNIASSAVAGLLIVIAAAPVTLRAQRLNRSGPPLPFEDFGACPFEGCAYREWTARDRVVVRTRRSTDARVAFRLRPKEKVTALTGVVVTIEAGRVRFREPDALSTAAGPIHVRPGQILYLLTYHGEGYTTAWFQGRLYREVDGSMAFFNGWCEHEPSRCTGDIVARPRSVWWVQIRNAKGQVGWTSEPEKFDGKNALGG